MWKTIKLKEHKLKTIKHRHIHIQTKKTIKFNITILKQIRQYMIKNGFTIITEDKHFIKKIKSLGGLVVDSKEFISSLEKKK